MFGFESFYLATDRGEIISLRRGTVLKCGLGPNGYFGTTLCGLKRRQASVHTFIAETFIGLAPTPRHEVNHIDTNKRNNSPLNLEWLIRPKNIQHALENGAIPSGEESHLCRKLSENDVLEIRSLKGIESQSSLATRFGVSQSFVGKIHRFQKWKYLKTTPPTSHEH